MDCASFIGLILGVVGGLAGLLSRFSVHHFGLLPGCLLWTKVGVPSLLYDERLQFMSRQDALHLDESLDVGDVSRA